MFVNNNALKSNVENKIFNPVNQWSSLILFKFLAQIFLSYLFKWFKGAARVGQINISQNNADNQAKSQSSIHWHNLQTNLKIVILRDLS